MESIDKKKGFLNFYVTLQELYVLNMTDNCFLQSLTHIKYLF